MTPINGKDPHLQNPIPTRRINMPRGGGGEPPKKGFLARVFGCGLFLFLLLSLPTLGLAGVALLVGRWAA